MRMLLIGEQRVHQKVDVLGAFVPIAVVQMAACVAIFAFADALLTKAGILSSLSGTRRSPGSRSLSLFFCAIGFALP